MSTPAVIFGGPSPEHDVSILTGLQAARALAQSGPVAAIYWSKAAELFEVDAAMEASDFVDGVPAKARALRLVAGPGGGFVASKSGPLGKERALEISAVVNCCHGGPGEDGTLQAALDLAGIAYTGPTAAGANLGMDKLAFAGVVAAAGLPVLPKALLTRETPDDPGFAGPYIVKPRFGGSSIGIDIVHDVATARLRLDANVHLRQGAVIEPYRPSSADLNVAVRTHPHLQLSPIERPLRREEGGDILGYADKYLGGEGMVSAPRELPADVPEEIGKRVREMAAEVAALASVRGSARIDFLWEGDDVWVNEINTIPGSLSTYLWAAADVPIGTLLRDMLDEAATKPATHWTSAGADGTALRSAGSIASKLG